MASQALLFQSLEKLSKEVVGAAVGGRGREGVGNDCWYMQPSASVIPRRSCHSASSVTLRGGTPGISPPFPLTPRYYSAMMLPAALDCCPLQLSNPLSYYSPVLGRKQKQNQKTRAAQKLPVHQPDTNLINLSREHIFHTGLKKRKSFVFLF